MGFALVSFRFPDTVRFLPARQNRPVRIVFPDSGESWATAPEIALALSLGAEIIQHGIIIPWRQYKSNDAHPDRTSMLRVFTLCATGTRKS
jgi:hypothetical protein